MKKTEDTKIDLQSLLRNKIDNMLITTSWVGKVKELIGLEAVSPVWGNKPAWYFWTSQISGAYLIELDETIDEQWESDHLASGMFKVKHYPDTKGKVFANFSFEEQAFVQSNLFDHTHTPKFETKDRIPDSLFNVAALELTMDPKDNLALFTFEALDSMQICYDQGMCEAYPQINKEKHYIAGKKARNVPGYDLGYPLFSSLLCLYSFYSRTKPVRVLLTRSPGFKYVCNSSKKTHCIDTDDTHIYSLNVLFSDNREKTTARGEKLFEQRFKE
ncbi:MAG: hypothetical protein KJ668_09265, partial [Proteobacteria bacterium]|nr:hypothetical protein [Pseudomonadota bacterium]